MTWSFISRPHNEELRGYCKEGQQWCCVIPVERHVSKGLNKKSRGYIWVQVHISVYVRKVIISSATYRHSGKSSTKPSSIANYSIMIFEKDRSIWWTDLETRSSKARHTPTMLLYLVQPWVLLVVCWIPQMSNVSSTGHESAPHGQNMEDLRAQKSRSKLLVILPCSLYGQIFTWPNRTEKFTRQIHVDSESSEARGIYSMKVKGIQRSSRKSSASPSPHPLASERVLALDYFSKAPSPNELSVWVAYCQTSTSVIRISRQR